MTSITNQLNSIYSQLPSLSGSNFLKLVTETSAQARNGLASLANRTYLAAAPLFERASQFAAANSAILQYTGIAVAATLTLVIALKILKAYTSPATTPTNIDGAAHRPASSSPSEGEAHSAASIGEISGDPASALTSEGFSTDRATPTPPPITPDEAMGADAFITAYGTENPLTQAALATSDDTSSAANGADASPEDKANPATGDGGAHRPASSSSSEGEAHSATSIGEISGDPASALTSEGFSTDRATPTPLPIAPDKAMSDDTGGAAYDTETPLTQAALATLDDTASPTERDADTESVSTV